jgi:hypothetical protein
MGKRKIKNANFNHFSDDGGRNREDASYEETNAAFFGQFADIQAVKQLRVEKVNIFDIVPDLLQPRRVVPSRLRQYWHGNPQEIHQLFDKWLEAINADRQAEGYPPFNLQEALEMVETDGVSPSDEHAKQYDEEHRMPRMFITPYGIRIDPRDLQNEDPIDDGFRPEWLEAPSSAELKVQLSKFSTEVALIHIVTLAASIRQDGLTNPITIAKHDKGYIIETGERRWMSYHLLYYVYDGDWDKIPARIVDKPNIWRQASENNARKDLNAVSKARQLARLIMSIYQERHVYFKPIEDFDHEQDYYAQVADGDKWRIPRGEGQKVLTMLGFTNMVQLRQHRALLRMSKELWDFADDNNVTEYELREIIRLGMMPSAQKPAPKTVKLHPEPELSLFHKHWTQLAERQRALARRMTPEDRHKMVVMMRALADEIEKMK